MVGAGRDGFASRSIRRLPTSCARVRAADERDQRGPWHLDRQRDRRELHGAARSRDRALGRDLGLTIGWCGGVLRRGSARLPSSANRCSTTRPTRSKVALVALVERLQMFAGLSAARHRVGHPAPGAVRCHRGCPGRDYLRQPRAEPDARLHAQDRPAVNAPCTGSLDAPRGQPKASKHSPSSVMTW